MRVLEIQKLDTVIQDALHSANGEPIQLARQQKAQGKVKTLADMSEK